MQNSINYLNSKIWYRLLKTIYICLFLVIIGFSLLLLYSSNYPIKLGFNYEKSKIVCQLGNKSIFTKDQVFSGSDLLFRTEEYYTNERLRMLIQKKCEISTNSLNNFYIIRGETKNGFTPFLWSNGIEQIPAIAYAPNLPTGFQINEKYDYSKYIFWKIIATFVVLTLIYLVFEVIRRTFYYIILGSIKPKK